MKKLYILLVFITAIGFATTINVPGDYSTIQAGIDATSDGDTILVAAGTYIENINYNGKKIAVIGEGRETTIIDGNQNGSVVTFNSFMSGEDSTSVLKGFTIQNGSADYGGGIYCYNYSSPILTDITITNNSATNAGGGINIYFLSYPTLANVTITNNSASYGGGIYCYTYTGPSFRNVTITNNSATNAGGGIYCKDNSNPSFVNCILWNDLPNEIYFDEGTETNSIIISYSNIKGGENGIVTNDNGTINWGEGNIDANPLFCNPDSGDYTLADNSPCVGTGVNGSNVVFTKPDSADWTLPENQDRITDNVWITRKDIQSLFNISQEDGYSYPNGSPVGTLWSDTVTAAADPASYTNFVAMHGGAPQSLIGDTVSLYLPQDGLYYDVTFLSYSGGNTGGGFSYNRTSTMLSANMGAFGVGCEAIIFEPVITDIEDQEMIEDSTLVVTISASSYYDSDLSYYVESDADTSIFSELFITQPPGPGNWVGLRITPQENWFGNANIIIIVTDENNLSDTTDFTLTVIPVNDRPEDFTLLYPTISDTFSTHVDSDTAIAFTWEESYDVDSDVTYTLTIELEFFGNTYTDVHENISDTTISISSNSLDPLLDVTSQDEAIFTYTVQASDEEYTVVSDLGQFVLSRSSLSTINNDLVPQVFVLHQNHPNPFNPVTTLRYDLPEDALVNITIYDMMGRQVNTLVSSQQSAGYKSVRWNATNDNGASVSAGLYLYMIQAGEFRQTRKMVLLK